MFQSIKQALSIREVRRRLMFLLFGLALIRVGAQIPVPGIEREAIQAWMGSNSGAFGFFALLSGGSLSNMSVFALSITPYITASIIMELMTVVIPALKEMSEEGETGRQKKANITKYLGIAASVLQATATMWAFHRQGLLGDSGFLEVAAAAVAMTAGASFLIWFADRLTDHGFGNGSSFILLVNICSRIPAMIRSLFVRFVSGQSIAPAILCGLLVVLIILATILMVVILEGGERKIPVTNSQNIQLLAHLR